MKSRYLLVFHQILLIFLFVFTIKSTAFSQDYSFRFERLSVEDGLPHVSALDIVQDKKGFMWFGTLIGVARYDGYTFKHYHPSVDTSFTTRLRDVPVLFVDSDGGIWLGSYRQDAKLFKYHPELDDFVPYLFDPQKEKQIIQVGVCSIEEDNTGHLIVATYGDGLLRINKNANTTPALLPYQQFKNIAGDPNSLPVDDMEPGLTKDKNGHIWIPTTKGITHFDPNDTLFQTYAFSVDTAKGANFCINLMADDSNNIWVPSIRKGLFKFNIHTKIFEHFVPDATNKYSIHSIEARNLTVDGKKRIWIANGRGVDMLEPAKRKFQQIEDGNRLYGDATNFIGINDIFTDQSGNIWMAAWKAGIYMYNPEKEKFKFLNPLKPLSQEGQSWAIQTIHEQNKDQIWIATQGEGLFFWDKKQNSLEHFIHDSANRFSVGSNKISRILSTDKHLFIGLAIGVDRYHIDKKRFEHIQTPYNGNAHRPFLTDHFGKTWISIWDKDLCYLEKQGQQLFCLSEQEKYDSNLNYIIWMALSPNGDIWAGTNQQGLYRIDPITGKSNLFLEDQGVHYIYFDRTDQCWLSVYGKGLALFNTKNGTIKYFGNQANSPLQFTKHIYEDEQGFLWVWTQTGMVKFDPTSKKTVRFYHKRNWMKKNQRWTDLEVVKQLRNGEIIITTEAGFFSFHPQKIVKDSVAPLLALTEFQISNQLIHPGEKSVLKKEIAYAREIHLAYNQNNIGFTYAALSFKELDNIEYAYRLDGYDKKWQYVQNQRKAAYTNLNPGEYYFTVKAANSDGVWSPENNAVKIVIHPHWALSKWAKFIYILAGILLLYLLRSYELNRQLVKSEAKRLQELDQVKTRLYTNITHEFRTPLTIILGMADQLKTQIFDTGKEGLSMIKRNGQELLQLVNQMLDLSKLETGGIRLDMIQADVVSYLKYIVESFHSLAENKQINLKLESAIDELWMDFEPVRLREVLGNLISNGIKFTPKKGVVVVTIEQSNQALKVIIEDTGIGISAVQRARIFDRFYQADNSSTRSTKGTGLGLAISSELVKLMGGQISVDSTPGKGSTFIISIPITQNAPLNTPPLSQPIMETHDEPAIPIKTRLEASKNLPLLLIIEDNNDVVQYLQSCIGNTYQIEVAKDGKEGIQKAIELIPDLIISDVMMPYADGFEVCKTLKIDTRTSHIPIIMLTAKADIASKLQGLKVGADVYLPKPFNEQELLIRIAKLLELRHNLQAYYLSLADSSSHEVPTNDVNALDPVFVQKIRDIVLDHINDASFSVEQLSKKMGLSRSQLHRKITALTNYSSGQFIRYIRLAKARELLQKSDLNIAEIAYDTGFADPDYFSKVFKGEFGVTPTAFRNNRREG